jgi:anti-sigma regulatory factor (Ser/Thr protein kinase)
MALRLAESHELDEDARGRIALVVTELGTNLVRHAKAGRILVACSAVDDGSHFEVLSIDSGPGMHDINHCLRDGYSSGTTPGTGFGAVKRLSTEFSAFSAIDRGTVILSRICISARGAVLPRAVAASGFAHAGICLAAPGEAISGDAWGIRIEGATATVMVADGLGHGSEAAAAAEVALSAFVDRGPGSPSAALEHIHPLMRQTRGAAVAISALDLRANTVVTAGAGNICGRILSGLSDRSLLSQHGTLGLQIRTLRDATYAWPEHSLVVMHSDGLKTRWDLAGVGGLLRCDPAVVAAWLVRDHARGADDVTVVVVKRA